jgi:hypothetical protein
MASFDFTSVVLDEGTTFIFGSWICIANDLGGFNSHLAETSKLEALVATQCSDLDEFIDNLDEMLLPDLAGEIEKMSVLDTTSNCAVPRLPGSDSTRSEEGCTRFPFTLRNLTSVYQEAMRFESLSDLEEDSDHLLKIGDEGATACRGGTIFHNYSDSDDNPESFSGSHLGLTITTTPQSRFVYLKGMEPSGLPPCGLHTETAFPRRQAPFSHH